MISPLLQQGGNLQRCLVKHVLTVDWKHWNTCWSPACDKDITLHVLERVACWFWNITFAPIGPLVFTRENSLG